MFQIISGKEAVKKIKANDNLLIIGNLNLLEPETILYELEQSFLQNQQPADLTVLFPVFLGSAEGRGVDYFAHDGFVKRLIGGSFASMLPNRKMNEFIFENKVEAYNLPMGTFYHLLLSTGAGQGGLLTGVGINTFADPRQGGGRLNDCDPTALVVVKEIDGKEWLYYKPLHVDVAIIRGTSVDEMGNISLEDEPTSQGIFATALAAKQNGGIVIAQVRRKVKSGSVHPRLVMVPGRLVDYVVFDERDEAIVSKHPKSVLGEIRQPVELKEVLPLDQRKVILRRIALEVRKGDLINLGFGIPANLPSVAAEEGILEDLTFSIEHGPVGGVPGWTGVFGVAMNPDMVLDSNSVFAMYGAGMLNLSCLGMGEADQHGHVNNHKFKNIIAGTGGFNDIVHATPKIILAGTFTAGGLKTSIVEGKLVIEQEGKHKKFLPNVEGITLNADEARKKGQQILYITERAVFELGERGIVLIEIAPGIDVERDIKAILDFDVEVSPNLKIMDRRIFVDEPMGLSL